MSEQYALTGTGWKEFRDVITYTSRLPLEDQVVILILAEHTIEYTMNDPLDRKKFAKLAGLAIEDWDRAVTSLKFRAQDRAREISDELEARRKKLR